MIKNCAKSFLESFPIPVQSEKGMSKEIQVPGFGFGIAGLLAFVTENSMAFASAAPPSQFENFKLKLLSKVASVTKTSK